MSASPRVSVIVNCYNGERFLAAALDSVRAQTVGDWELVIWDDGSTDGSAQVAAGYTDPRIRYFRSPERTGLGPARALAIGQARGEWLALLDQDDLWQPDKLARQLSLVDSSPACEVGLVYGRAVRFAANGEERPFDHVHGAGPLPEGDIFTELMRHGNFIAPSSAIVSRRAYDEAGGIPAGYEVAAEYVLFAAICRTHRAAAVQVECCRYREHEANLSRSVARRAHEEALRVVESWSSEIPASLLRQRRRVYETLLGWEDVRDGRVIEGSLRILRRGSVGYLLSRPVARARRRFAPGRSSAAGGDWSEIRRRLREDRARLQALIASGDRPRPLLLAFYPPFLCVALYRLSHLLLAREWGIASRLVWQLNLLLTGADIHPHCDFGGGLLIPHPMAVSISGNAGKNLTLLARAGLGGELPRREDRGAGPGLACLGDDVVLAPHSGVLGPVTVGSGAFVFPGCLVPRDIPPGVRVLPIARPDPSPIESPAAPPPEPAPLDWKETRRRLAHDRVRIGGRLSFGYACVWLHRVSHYFHRRGLTRLASLLWHVNLGLTGADIHPRSDLGEGLFVPYPAGVSLDGRAGANLTVFALAGIQSAGTAGVSSRCSQLPDVGADVELGPRSVVVGPVHVGSGSRVGPGEVVAESLAAGTHRRAAPPRMQGGRAGGSSAPISCQSLGHERPATLRRELREDRLRILRESGRGSEAPRLGRELSTLLMPGVLALALYRTSHLLHVRGFPRTARAVAGLNVLVFKASIPPATCLAGGCYLPHPVGTVLEANAGRDLTVYAQALCMTSPGTSERPPRLGDGVTLGGHSVVVGPVEVGDGVRLVFRVVLDRDAPAGSVVASRALLTRFVTAQEPESTDS
jgi:serine acetyltransferase/glycosyltransferase involved in cell wall biosynthesis